MFYQLLKYISFSYHLIGVLLKTKSANFISSSDLFKCAEKNKNYGVSSCP